MKIYLTEKAHKEKDSLGYAVSSKFDTLFEKATKGSELSKKDYKKLAGYSNLCEFRVKHNTNIYRGLGGFIKKDVFVVLFIRKKSQRLPRNVIKKVQNRLKQI